MRFSIVATALAFALTAQAAAVGNTFEEREADFSLEDLEFAVREAEAEAEPEQLFARAKCSAQIKAVPKCAVSSSP
jgi:hypothetical protein